MSLGWVPTRLKGSEQRESSWRGRQEPGENPATFNQDPKGCREEDNGRDQCRYGATDQNHCPALLTMGAKEQRDVGRPSSNQKAEQTRLSAWSQASVGEGLTVSAYWKRCELRSMETPGYHIPPTTRASAQLEATASLHSAPGSLHHLAEHQA